MKPVRWAIVALLLVLGSVEASGQVSQITANNIVDGGGKKLKAGIIDFYPVTLAGNPIQPQMGGGGVILYKPAECLVVHGAITTASDGSICTTADTALTNQAHFCYKTVVKDTSVVPNNIFPAMKCLQPTGSVWSMDDSYTPDAQPTALVQMGPKGDKGDPGTGNVSPGAAGQLSAYNTSGTGTSVGPTYGISTDGAGNLNVNGQTSTSSLSATIGSFSNNLASPVGNLDSVFSRYLSASQSVTSPIIQGVRIGAIYQVDQFTGTTFDSMLNQCLTYGGLNSGYVGNFICDARHLGDRAYLPATLTVASNLTFTNSGSTVLLPCNAVNFGTNQLIIPSTVTDIDIEGCGQGVTTLIYSGNSTFIAVGDPTFASNTSRVHFKHLSINTNTGGNIAVAMAFYRTQDIEMDDVELNGKGVSGSVQLGMLLDGTGNYSGGTFRAVHLNSYPMGIDMKGHDSGSAVGDFANASTFERLHINCPAFGEGLPNGVGIYAEAADGNTWIGGDIEGCYKMVELGANAVNNTFIGVRNENSNIQYQADSGSAYNLVLFGGTLYTNQLIDNGSRNSFIDAFHHTENGIKGDWYASQQDATIVNHLRLGTGSGVVRGLQWESQVDQGTSGSIYNWLWGLSDGASGQSNWFFQDLLNNVQRVQIQQNNTPGGNAPTAINGAGTGNVCFQCSTNSGTGGVAFSSGGASPTTVATVNNAGSAQFNGTLQVGSTSTFGGTTTVKNQADAEIDSVLWAGATAAQKEAYVYKDWNGTSQWYTVKDASNNWALNGALDNIDHVKAYQSGDTYIDAAGSGVVRVNYEASSGSGGMIVYSGGASPSQWFAVTGSTSFKFPGIATATSGYGDVRLDTSGWLSNAGAYTSSGTASGSTTTASHTFATAYTSTPACTATPTSNVGSFYISSQSTTAITITYATSGTGTFNVICRGPGGIY